MYGNGNSNAPTLCSSIASEVGPSVQEINVPVVKVDLYLVIPNKSSMKTVIDTIRTQIGRIVKELKNPIDYSTIFDTEMNDSSNISELSENHIRETIDHKLDLRIGICLYGDSQTNQKALHKELTDHIPGVQLFLG